MALFLYACNKLYLLTLFSYMLRVKRKSKVNTLLALMLVGTSGLSSYAQVEQVDRIEISISRDFEIRSMYNFGKDGVLLSTKETSGKSKRDPDRVYRHFNTNLEETNSYSVEVPFRQKFTGSFEGDSSVFILNHDTKFGDFTLIELRASDLRENRTTGKLPPKTNVSRFFCYGDFAVLFARVGKRRQKIITVNLTNGELNETDLKADSRKKVFGALDHYVNGDQAYLLLDICSKKSCDEYMLFHYMPDGTAVVSEVNSNSNQIVSASISTVNKNEIVIAGTYSSRNLASAEGMFISLHQGAHQKYFKAYPFTEFDRFFDYLSARQKNRLERVKRRKKAKGRIMNYNIRMVLHEVIQLGSDYVVVGEAYYPTYRSETRSGPNGTTITTTVFDGYQYSHATLVTFSPDGTKKYDNTFKMYLLNKPYMAKKFIEVGVDNNTLNMIYVDGNSINTKAFSNGEVVEQEQWELLKTQNENDRVRGTTSEIEYWYDKYFISHGFQYIKNRKDRGVNRRRHVFYLQKLKY
jgi:hypothetical protein